jgi:hypothetical protein
MHELWTLAWAFNALNVEVDEAFTPGADSMLLFEADESTRGVALYQKYRMHEQSDLKAAAIEFADNGIHQERHIVIDDLKNRHATAAQERLESYFWNSGAAFGEKRPRPLGDARQFLRIAVLKILRRCEREQFLDESIRHVGPPLREEARGRVDKRQSAAAIATAAIILKVHVSSAYDANNSL